MTRALAGVPRGEGAGYAAGAIKQAGGEIQRRNEDSPGVDDGWYTVVSGAANAACRLAQRPPPPNPRLPAAGRRPLVPRIGRGATGSGYGERAGLPLEEREAGPKARPSLLQPVLAIAATVAARCGPTKAPHCGVSAPRARDRAPATAPDRRTRCGPAPPRSSARRSSSRSRCRSDRRAARCRRSRRCPPSPSGPRTGS